MSEPSQAVSAEPTGQPQNSEIRQGILGHRRRVNKFRPRLDAGVFFNLASYLTRPSVRSSGKETHERFVNLEAQAACRPPSLGCKGQGLMNGIGVSTAVLPDLSKGLCVRDEDRGRG